MRWRHLARRDKDLLLCGKNLAIEPCYKATTEEVSWSEWYVGVKFKHAKIENNTWHGVYRAGLIYTDEYLATYTLDGIEILGSENSDFSKRRLSGGGISYSSGDVVRATISVKYSFMGSGSPTYPQAKPSDRTYTEDYGSILEGFAPIPIAGVKSGSVVIERSGDGESISYVKTRDGSVGYVTKGDIVSGKLVNIISIDPPEVSIWSEGGSETYTDYTPVDDDDNY